MEQNKLIGHRSERERERERERREGDRERKKLGNEEPFESWLNVNVWNPIFSGLFVTSS